MRISKHPILEFKRNTPITFLFDGKEICARKGETIAVALHAAGIRALGHSHNKKRARGLFCAIGNCSSCMVVVNGEANVKSCIELARHGMIVETQKDKGCLV
jgi:predicted molibdopterin-dependent oxidoreductase YjgC